jgi:general secretion pathway protein H
VPVLPSLPGVRQRGFTLIEILVVVVIIALMAAVMTVAVGALGGDRQIEEEADRIADVLSVTLEQAELEGRDYGLRIEPDGYEVMVFDGRRGWTPAGGDRWFERHGLPPGLSVSLEAEGRLVLLRKAETPESRLPQVITFSSGDVTPYRITLTRSSSGATNTVEGAFDGTIEVTRGEER